MHTEKVIENILFSNIRSGTFKIYSLTYLVLWQFQSISVCQIDFFYFQKNKNSILQDISSHCVKSSMYCKLASNAHVVVLNFLGRRSE